MKLFVDDIRDAPDNSWVIARNFDSVIEILQHSPVSIISLDHDLGTDQSGYDIAKWIEKKVFCDGLYPIPEILCHSQNPVGKKNILAVNEAIQKHFNNFPAK